MSSDDHKSHVLLIFNQLTSYVENVSKSYILNEILFVAISILKSSLVSNVSWILSRLFYYFFVCLFVGIILALSLLLTDSCGSLPYDVSINLIGNRSIWHGRGGHLIFPPMAMSIFHIKCSN